MLGEIKVETEILPSFFSQMISTWVKNAVVVLVSSGLFLAAAEVFFRSTITKAGGENEQAFDPMYGLVSERSWIFADPLSIPGRKDDGDLRILFLGDSGTAGFGVGRQNSFPSQVGKLLNEISPSHQVTTLNAGEAGMAPIHELTLYQRRLAALKPDVIVMALFLANDINFGNSFAKVLLRNQEPPASAYFLRFLRKKSALVHFVTSRLVLLNQRIRFISASTIKEKSLWQSLSLMDSYGFEFLNYCTGEIATYMKTPSSLMNEAFDILGEVLKELKADAETHHAKLLVLLIPTSSSISNRLDMNIYPDAESELSRLNLSTKDLDFSLPTRHVLLICKKLNISCLDPTPEFRELGARGAIRVHDDHPTIQGHGVLARRLTSALLPMLSRVSPGEGRKPPDAFQIH